MKKMYNLLFNLMPCLFVMTLAVTVASAQCPVGQTKVDVTYTTGGFNGENSWVLYDVTAGVDLLCQTSNPPGGTQSVCVTDNNVIELQGYESFGDGWCPPANIVLAVNENGSANGCANPNGASPGTVIELYNGNTGASGNGTALCNNSGTSTTGSTGAVAVSFSTFCPSCDVTCPDDITVGTDPGVCQALVTIPDPTIAVSPDCEILGSPGNVVTRNGAAVPYIYAPNLVDTPFSVSGVAALGASVPCATEICIDFNATGDHSFFTEDSPIFMEGVFIGRVAFGGFDCVDRPFQICVPLATYDVAAADGTLNFILGADPDVNSFCGAATVRASVSYPTACVGFINSFTGLENGPAVYPLGTTCVNITGTGSGFGVAFPINCEVKVTVEDDENPTLDCPADFTFNLQGGECSETITFNEPEIMDNCGAEVAAQLPNICDNSLAATNNWNIQCTGATTGITMAMDMSGFGSVALGQVCFLQANPF
jgi:hypothetical protein